jgi:hypothetical protein
MKPSLPKTDSFGFLSDGRDCRKMTLGEAHEAMIGAAFAFAVLSFKRWRDEDLDEETAKDFENAAQDFGLLFQVNEHINSKKETPNEQTNH